MFAALVKITPFVEDLEVRPSIYLCSANDRRITALGGSRWEPAITEAPAVGMQFWNGDFQQGTDAGNTKFGFDMAKAALSYPEVLNASWMSADVEVMLGKIGDPWPWITRFKGKVTDYGSDEWPTQSLSVAVDIEPFNANVLIETYAGTGGAEGDGNLKEQVKPLALGWLQNVEPVLINEVDSVYQFSAYGPIENVITLYERASAFSASSGDFASYAALVAADIEPGHWATCLAQGLIRLGAPAAGVITGDVRGHAVSGAAPRAAGDLVRIIADIASIPDERISLASLASMDAEGATDSDVLIKEQVTFLEATRRMVLPCNRQVVISNVGVMVAMKPRFSDPELTLHAQGKLAPLVFSSAEEATSLPYKKTTMAAELSWRVHTFDEIATSATLIDKGDYDPATVYREGNIVTMPGGSRWEFISQTPQAGVTPGTNPLVWASMEGGYNYADGTPIEDLKPAEPAADVTSQIEGVVSVTIQCDETGAPLAGEVPRENAYKLYRNGVDITGDTDWSVTVLNGTITVSIDASTGILTISAISSDSRVRVGAQYTNPDTLFLVERSVEIDVKRQINIPPAAPTSAYGTINGHVTGTTMFAIAPELQVTVAASGNVALNAFYNFTVTGSFTAGAYAQWYRWNGTVYVPLGSEVASSTTANGSIEPGDGACAYSDTGRTAGSLEKYRLYGRSSNVRQVNFSGNVSAVSS